ncbi:TIGR03643 family protein [soil metagenome]
MKSPLTPAQISNVIRLAWEDRTTFEEIRERTGLVEREVITVMRLELKPSSFRMWRKRVSGRVTKHRRLLEKRLSGPGPEDELDDN